LVSLSHRTHAAIGQKAKADFSSSKLQTIKLSCRKDDRAMCPKIWVPWKMCGVRWLLPRLYFSRNF